MSASLRETITEAMKTAMRAKDARKLGTIRLLLAAIKQKEVDERITLDESQLLGIIDTMMKQRRGSIAEFEKAGRTDLVDQEAFEITVLQEFLPPALSDDEITEMIQKAIADSQASSMKDMGKVMAILKPLMQGRADLGKIGGQIKDLLNQ